MVRRVESAEKSTAHKARRMVPCVLFDGRPISVPDGRLAVVFEPLNDAARVGKFVLSQVLTERLYGPLYDPGSKPQVRETVRAVNRLNPALPSDLMIATGYLEEEGVTIRSTLTYGFKYRPQMPLSEIGIHTPAIPPVIEQLDSPRGILPEWIVDSIIPSDQEVQLWIRQFQDGDKGLFNQIQEVFAARVYRHVYYRAKNPATAEDLTQETFFKAYRALDTYRHNGKNPFVSWLLTIAQNLVISQNRKHVEVALDDQFDVLGSDADGLLQEVMGHLSADKLREAVNQLKGNQKAVIAWRFFEDLDYSIIAQRLGKKESHIRVIQHRAVANLRKMLQ